MNEPFYGILEVFLTEDGKCETGIWRHIEMAKDAFQKLSTLLTENCTITTTM